MGDIAAPAPHRSLSPPWRVALPALLLVLATVLFLYRDTALAMVNIWARSETFTHAFLVPPIVVWLLWRQRERLLALAPRPSAWMLVPLAAVALVWLLGELAAVNALTQFAFTALLVLAVPAVLGLRVARAAMFPLGFLFFSVPIGEFLLPQLMEWTADFTIAALRLSDIPVYREGLQFVIPSGRWSVVEACSGVRYLIASFMVGTLFAYLTYQSRKRRLIFMAIAIVVPLLANWVRAYMIVMLGHLSDNKIAVGVDHLVYGWVFFGVVIFLLFMIGARWAEPPQAHAAGRGAGPSLPQLPNNHPVLAAVAAAVVVLVALPPLAQRAIAQADGAGAPVLVAPATLAAGWQTSSTPVADWTPVVDNPSAELKTAYAKDGSVVGLYVAYFSQQGYQRKLVGAENMLVASSDTKWHRVAAGREQLDVAGTPVTLRTAELRNIDNTAPAVQPDLILWQMYWINGRLTTSEHLAKAYVALNRLMGRGDDAAVIVFYTPKSDGVQADAALAAFVKANLGALDTLLRQAGSRP